jgi:hypothetical protein
MQLRFTVNSCAVVKIPVQFTMPNGTPVEAEARGVIVELVPEVGDFGQTLRFVPEDINAALAEYAPGTVVTATYETEQA